MTGLKLLDQVWIVTGAASGIGRAIARLFASEGARTVVADVTQQVIEGGVPTIDVIAAEGGNAIYLPTDVSQREQVDATVAETVARYGRLDGIVNNACIRHARPLLEMDESDWERVLKVNLTGTYLSCRAAVRQMIIQEPRGKIDKSRSD
jgi:NAD(P)-dependent dehydrogenase (short-subunit alcohol dehydrogenase family)